MFKEIRRLILQIYVGYHVLATSISVRLVLCQSIKSIDSDDEALPGGLSLLYLFILFLRSFK